MLFTNFIAESKDHTPSFSGFARNSIRTQLARIVFIAQAWDQARHTAVVLSGRSFKAVRTWNPAIEQARKPALRGNRAVPVSRLCAVSHALIDWLSVFTKTTRGVTP